MYAAQRSCHVSMNQQSNLAAGKVRIILHFRFSGSEPKRLGQQTVETSRVLAPWGLAGVILAFGCDVILVGPQYAAVPLVVTGHLLVRVIVIVPSIL